MFNSKILKKSILNKINFIKTTSDSTRASLIIRYSDKIPTLSLEGRYYLVCFYNYRITSSRIQKLNFFKSKIYYSNFNNRYISKIQLVRLNLNYIVFRNSGDYIIIQNKDLLEFNFKNFISIFKIKGKGLNLYFLFTKLGFIQKKLILNFQKNFQKDNKLKLSGEDLIIKVVQYRNNIGCVVQTDLNECVCIDLKLLQNYTNLKLKNFLKKKLKPKSNIINMQIIYIDKRYNIIDDYGFFFTINLKNLNQFQNKLKKSRQKIILMKKFSYKLILIIFLNKLKVYQTTIHKINKKSHRKKILPLLNGQKKNFLVKIIQL
ncbi:hypothetical protein E5P55_00375 [Candidatus Pinguicoccus supinus]|uniref:Uncharacterized protein n=1 Tax=Candidatus Pinguicoccus supinus TaxID=2529394 RepID=A0A7T0BSD9_9BACT|nr:hypothetical protein E5P55_00375 [Candidatus Pinguicoccus supinus]